MSTSTTADLALHKEALTKPVDEIASELQEQLGQRLVAYATGIRSPRVVGRWAHGVEPHEQHALRLRELYRTCLLLEQDFSPTTIRAWLQSANPDLEDEAPIQLLRDGNDTVVIRAAQTFRDA